jgi:hypothetical protein
MFHESSRCGSVARSIQSTRRAEPEPRPQPTQAACQGSGGADQHFLTLLQQQRDDEIFLVIEVTDQLASEIGLGIVQAGEVGAERVGSGNIVGQQSVRRSMMRPIA